MLHRGRASDRLRQGARGQRSPLVVAAQSLRLIVRASLQEDDRLKNLMSADPLAHIMTQSSTLSESLSLADMRGRAVDP